MSVSAIIVAAGGSRRMGFDKLSADLCGRPVLSHAIEAFCRCDAVFEVIIVCSDANAEWVDAIVGVVENKEKIAGTVRGGAERHLSVWNGIEAARRDAEMLAVHDGARPLVTPEAISSCVTVAAETGAATLAHPINDTVKRCDSDGQVIEAVDRTGLWAMETPQVFRAALLRDAYRSILDRGEIVTDEVSAVQASGHNVRVVVGDRPNPKITWPGDLAPAARILESTW